MPRLFTHATCGPVTPTCAERMRVPLERSACSTDVRIDSEASRRFSTMPRFSPFAAAMPTPRMRSGWSGSTSPTTVQTFVVPTSMDARTPPSHGLASFPAGTLFIMSLLIRRPPDRRTASRRAWTDMPFSCARSSTA